MIENVLGSHVNDPSRSCRAFLDGSRSLHGERFSTARLAVGKDRSIETGTNGFDNVENGAVVYLPRCRLFLKRFVKGEEGAPRDAIWKWLSFGGGLRDRGKLWKDLPSSTVMVLRRIQGSHSNDDCNSIKNHSG